MERNHLSVRCSCFYLYTFVDTADLDCSVEATCCDRPAEWRIWPSDYPDDPIDSCTQHVGYLLTNSSFHRIIPLPVEDDSFPDPEEE